MCTQACITRVPAGVEARLQKQPTAAEGSKLGRRKQRPMGDQAEPGHSQQGAYAPADPIAPRGEHRVWGGLGAGASRYVSSVLPRTCLCHFALCAPAHIVSASPHSPHSIQAVSLVSEPILRILHNLPCTQRICGASALMLACTVRPPPDDWEDLAEPPISQFTRI